MSKDIVVVALAVIKSGCFLLVRKRGSATWILPGGKPQPGEGDAEVLTRELAEELGCGLLPGSVHYLGTFSDAAADAPTGTRVHVRLYGGELAGLPQASAEIEELLWLKAADSGRPDLAPSLANLIIPYLLDSAGKWNADVRPLRG